MIRNAERNGLRLFISVLITICITTRSPGAGFIGDPVEPLVGRAEFTILIISVDISQPCLS